MSSLVYPKSGWLDLSASLQNRVGGNEYGRTEEAGDPLVQDHGDAEIRQVRLRIKKHESKEENKYLRARREDITLILLSSPC